MVDYESCNALVSVSCTGPGYGIQFATGGCQIIPWDGGFVPTIVCSGAVGQLGTGANSLVFPEVIDATTCRQRFNSIGTAETSWDPLCRSQSGPYSDQYGTQTNWCDYHAEFQFPEECCGTLDASFTPQLLPELVVDVPSALGLCSGAVLIGALAFVYVACSGQVARVHQNINARDEPRHLLVLEVSDALVDVAVFYTSLVTGGFTFSNDPGNIIMIVLAVLGCLSIVVGVVQMLMFIFRVESFIAHAPMVLIASLLVEDLFQLVMYIIIALSLSDINAPVVVGISKAGLMMLSKLAKIFKWNRCNRTIKAASEEHNELELAVARKGAREPAPLSTHPSHAAELESAQAVPGLGGRVSNLERRMLLLEEKMRLMGPGETEHESIHA